MDKSTLISSILENTNNYYNGKTCVPDEVFDKWIEELRAIDPTNPILTSVGWGYDVTTCNLQEYPHLNYLTGIANKPRVAKTEILPSGKVKTPKMDGGSAELQYVDGKLMRALTRGNGEVGIDCTSKMIHAQGVIVDLGIKYTGNVVGEFVISDEDLPSFTESTSQRNVPNGLLSRNYASPEDCSKFSFIAYKVGKSTTHQFKSRIEILDFLKNLGFLAVSYIMGAIPYQEAIDRLRLIGGKHYLLDGIVCDSTEIIMQPSGVITYVDEVAYKTVNETAHVKVKRIDWNLTRTGKLVPTVVTESVLLSGANVSRALGHHAKNILESGIDAGATIEIVRSGEVIPYIYGVDSPVEVKLPQVCPDCGAPLTWSGVNLVCRNPECSGQNYSNLYHWISNLANTDNLGGSLISAFIEFYDISEIPDFYKDYDLEVMSNMDGIGSAKIKVLKQALDNLKKSHSIENYLIALNIPGLSWESARKIVDGTSIRAEIAESYFSDEFEMQIRYLKGVNQPTKDNLLKNWGKIVDTYQYMNIEEPQAEDSSVDDNRIKVCITGKLEFGTKSKFYQKYSDKIVEADVKSCDYLIANADKGSSKYKTAEKLGKTIITEEDFIQTIL